MNKQIGYIALYGGKRLELPLSVGDLSDAKQEAIKVLKVPKSKTGLMAIAPGYSDND